MRKIIAIVLAVVMIAAMSVTVCAKNIDATDANQTGKGTTNVTYTSTESFVVVIPEDIGLTDEDGDGIATAEDKEVKLTEIKLSADKTITVRVAGNSDSLVSGHNYRLKDATTGGVIGYTITKAAKADVTGTTIEQNEILIQQASVKTFEGVTTYLDFATEQTVLAGSFADVLTFTATVTSSLNA